jgi:hypothetical protein
VLGDRQEGVVHDVRVLLLLEPVVVEPPGRGLGTPAIPPLVVPSVVVLVEPLPQPVSPAARKTSAVAPTVVRADPGRGPRAWENDMTASEREWEGKGTARDLHQT